MRIVTLSQLSLAGSSGIAEVKQPIWWADGTSVGAGNTSAGSILLSDGNQNGAESASSTTLFTLSSTWPSSMKFALESTFDNATSGSTANVALWDKTTNSIVANSTISTTQNTYSVIRSGQLTLTPGHSYGVTYWVAGGTCQVVDASLIIFP